MATIRVSEETHKKAADLADGRGETMSEVVGTAVDRLFRERFFDELDEDYAALRRNPELWQQELEERAAWQGFDPWSDE